MMVYLVLAAQQLSDGCRSLVSGPWRAVVSAGRMRCSWPQEAPSLWWDRTYQGQHVNHLSLLLLLLLLLLLALLFTAWMHQPTCATTPTSGTQPMNLCRTRHQH
jgi:hypothetical protein